jgi:hypothetical protein
MVSSLRRWRRLEAYKWLAGRSGSLPAAAKQAKMAMMTRRTAEYFIVDWFVEVLFFDVC